MVVADAEDALVADAEVAEAEGVAEAEEALVADVEGVADAEVLVAGAVEVEGAVDEAGAVDFEELVEELVEEEVEEVVLAVVEGATEDDDETFVLEDTTVEDFAELIGIAPVPGAWYIFSRYEPPQNSDELPAHCILQPEKPSGAGAPPPVIVLAQSSWTISMNLQ